MNIQSLRDETPGTRHRNHLNNAGAALMPQPVIDAVRAHLDLEAEIGGYEAADLRRDEIERARDDVARLVGAAPPNVAFTEHATASFAQALSSVPFRRGDVILTTRSDYISNQLMYLALQGRAGVEVVRAPDSEGTVDVSAMGDLIHRRRPRLVSVTHVPTNAGSIQNVAEVGRMCRDRDVLYLVDACQSVGQLPVDVSVMGCDFLAATARKFLRGPRGAGFLYVSDRALDAGLEPLFIDMQGADWIDDDLYQPVPDARRFETWEFAYALVLGMGAAARYALGLGLEAIRARCDALATRMRRGLAAIDGVRVLDRGAELAAIVTAEVHGWSPRDLSAALRERGINTSWHKPEWALLDYRDKGADGALRVSPHYYNTEDEVDALVDAVREMAQGRPG